MGERKVLNMYYPADFDPAKLPRRKQPKNQQMKIRNMLSMSICCNSCGSYMYKGTKINCRKEQVSGETYLGIRIFRFYFNCRNCSAELVIKTDPKNSDYVVEAGATRTTEASRQERDDDQLGGGDDQMKALEKRRLDSEQEVGTNAALDELQCMKARREKVRVDAMLKALQQSRGSKEAEEVVAVKSVLTQPKDYYVRRVVDGGGSRKRCRVFEGNRRLCQSRTPAVEITVETILVPESGNYKKKGKEISSNVLESLCCITAPMKSKQPLERWIQDWVS